MSTIQCGARSGLADTKKVCQSSLLAGEKILVPLGQLLLSADRRTSLHPVHATIGPAE